jgi:SAM-dependent methyltransferase
MTATDAAGLWSGRDADWVAPLPPNAWLRFDVINRLFPREAHDVLEIGCGQGAFGVRAAKYHRYVGLEPDPTSYAVAAQRFERAGLTEVRNIPVEQLASDETFDLICAFEVLEHIEDDAAALAEWIKPLRPGGSVMISVPAHQERYGPFDEYVGHFRRYDGPGMTALLEGLGFQDVVIRECGMPLGFILEAGRNVIGKRRLAAANSSSMQERTEASGRLMQPDGGLKGSMTRLGTKPFRMAQRGFPSANGTGLVARARLA